MRLSLLDELMNSLPGRGIPGGEVAIWRRHEEVYRRAVGYRDEEKRVPASGSDCYWLYSATKVLTCAGAMALVEKGLLDLDAPVYQYLPAWRDVRVAEGDAIRPPKRPITIRHLFAMQGGLNYDADQPPIREALRLHGDAADIRVLADALAKCPLDFDPGEHFQYSMCIDVLGAAIEAASGLTLEEHLRRSVFEPCGMDMATFHPTARHMENLACQYRWDGAANAAVPCGQDNFFAPTPACECGGAGVICRVDDYIRFADAMAMGGVAATGKRILMRESIDLMRTNAQQGACLDDFHKLRASYGYGLGVRTRMTHTDGGLSPIGEFGWDGAACCYCMMDPQHEVSLFFAMHVLDYGVGFEKLHPILRDTAYRALEMG